MCRYIIALNNHFPSVRLRLVKGAMAVSAFVLVFPLPAFANGLRENTSWQFETKYDRTQKAVILDLIERKKAGTYNSTYNNTSNTNYNISGHYIDCNMTSQSLGNQGGVTQDVPVGSPSIGVGSTTSSSASGNAGAGTIASGGDSSDTGMSSQSGGDTATNTSTAGGTNSVSTTLSNDGATQSSTATGNTFASTVSDVSGTGGGASVALNSTQSLADSNVSSSISASSACDFNSVSDSIGSPINKGGN